VLESIQTINNELTEAYPIRAFVLPVENFLK
jgi:hypothetical protein